METRILKGTLERSNFAELKSNAEKTNQEDQAQEEE